jgi:hypothetical protein
MTPGPVVNAVATNARIGQGVGSRFLILLVACNAAIGFVISRSPALATGHALAAVAIGLWLAVTSSRLQSIVMAAAYLAGCDVLWRMTDASVPWELGKLAVIVVLTIALIRFPMRGARSVLPLVYFALLLPSVILTIDALPTADMRDALSFNLSGPLALAVCALFFFRVNATWAQARLLYVALLSPIISIVTIASVATLSAGALEFTQESNFVTSGGFGPNQVSASLSLGALLCVLLLLRERRLQPRVLLTIMTLWLFGQTLLTFSRGGMYNLVIAGACVALLTLARSRNRGRVLLSLSVLLVLAWLLFTQLDVFTQGQLDERLLDTGPATRGDLIGEDVAVWEEHWFAGVGPGMTVPLETGALTDVASHTEFTRLLAEHGVAGLLAIVVLFAMVGRAYRRAGPPWARAVAIALAAWSLAEMSHGSMRIAATGFVFGLAMLRLDERPLAEAPSSDAAAQ